VRLLHKILLLTLLVAPAACTDAAGNPDLATEFRETPLRMLPGVQIGMQARQLRRTRPATRYAPYLGLQESIPGYGVSYRFESAVGDAEGSDVSPRDDLKAVYMARTFDLDEAAVAAWREQVATLVSSRRAPDVCDSIPGGGRQARWLSGKQELVAGVFPAPASPPRARLVLVVGRMDYIKQPQGATPVPCPKP
jgi:hypothetical protein